MGVQIVGAVPEIRVLGPQTLRQLDSIRGDRKGILETAEYQERSGHEVQSDIEERLGAVKLHFRNRHLEKLERVAWSTQLEKDIRSFNDAHDAARMRLT
mmetsp:Transcript_32176/g.102592  ORF Transcript_32176/g.102592 Transcript_32176/m.102592 type:complete len:99 (+) Transcript_32176:316-612(+)